MSFVITRTIEVVDHIETGKAFAKRRKQLGKTQKEIAELCGIMRNNLQQMESGKRKWSEPITQNLLQVIEELERHQQ